MRTNIMRSVAVALGFCTCGIAQAQYGGYPTQSYSGGTQPAYSSSAAAVHPSLQRPTPLPRPAGGSFRAVSNQEAGQPALTDPHGSGQYDVVPPPIPEPPNGRTSAGGRTDGSVSSQPPSLDGSCSSCNVGQIYNEAAAAPWIGSGAHLGSGPAAAFDATGPVKKWFGGGSLLFFDFDDDSDRRLVYADADPQETLLGTGEVSPGGMTGFEAFLGNYIHDGKYALTASYLLLDPSQEETILRAPMAGDYQAGMPNWSRMYIDNDGDGTADDVGVGGDNTDDTLYGAFDEAAAYRIRRDVRIQGLEFNFVSFGIGGALRGAAVDNCGCGTAGCGGMCGALVPACGSRLQLQVSHGLRWLQFKDAFEFAATPLADGYDDDDLYYDVRTRNDLLGYQFGSRANYCVTNRFNVYAGGKFGIYGNDADYRSRLGTGTTAAQVGDYYADLEDQSVVVRESDTVLSTLGELDLGLGFRLTDCWSLTGGYRMIGVTNVATSVGSISDDPANLTDGHGVRANDSLLLHGGYVGAQYNW